MVPNIGLFCRNSDNRVEKYDYVSLLSGKIRIVMNYARTLRSDHRIPISFKLIWIEFVCIIRKLFQINLVMKTYCAIKHITYAVALLMYSNSIELVLNGNDTDMLTCSLHKFHEHARALHSCTENISSPINTNTRPIADGTIKRIEQLVVVFGPYCTILFSFFHSFFF